MKLNLFKNKTKERKLFSELFEVIIFFKGLEGSLEIISGALLVYTAKTGQLIDIVLKITEHEIIQDPDSFLARKLVELVQNINPGVSFGMLYLLFHGLIKTILSLLLLKRKIWAYPVAIYIYSTLSLILIVEFFRKWSGVYLVLSGLDLLAVVLTIIDYKALLRKLKIDKEV
jgi:uncharacterized membrane protein